MLNKKYMPFWLNATICAILLAGCDMTLFFYNVPTFVVCVIDGLLIYLTPKFMAKYIVTNNQNYNIRATNEHPDKHPINQSFELTESDMNFVLSHHFKRTLIFWALCTGGLFVMIGLVNFLIAMISPESFVNLVDLAFANVDLNDESVESLIFHPWIIGTIMTLVVMSIVLYAIVAYINSKKLFNKKMINGKFYLI